MKLRLGVIFGGESVEHEVSIISAVQAMKHLNTEKYEVIPIYIGKDKEWYTGSALKQIDIFTDMDLVKRYSTNVVLTTHKDKYVLIKKNGIKRIVDYIDLVFPIVHGTNAEDGTLQGYLNLIGIPYAESNLYACSVGQDKVFQKQILSFSNILVPDFIWFFENEYKENEDEILKKIKKLGYPVMVKPARLGSSVGISKVNDEKNIKDAIEEAIKYDEKVLIEKVVENLVEVNCSVIGNYEHQEASLLEEVMGVDEFLSYKDKYLGGAKKAGKSSKGMASTNRILPARLDDKLTEEVRNLSKQIFRILNSTGVVRIDFLVDSKTKKVYTNEINTIPGSLSFYLWEASGKTYTEMLDEIINLAIKTYKKRKVKVFSFESNILSNFNGTKGKLKK